MKKRLLAVMMLLVLAIQIYPASGAEAERMLPVTFSNLMGSEPIHYQVAWREKDFTGDPRLYNHDLARASLGMALSAFHSYEEGKEPDANIRRFLTGAGFSDLRSDEYDQLISANSIGSVIGSRKLGDRTLVAVALRGGGYQGEWVGNMDMGSVEDEPILRHVGFQRAMKLAAERVREYASGLEGPLTFWIAGYSRAAAVSNLLAAELLDTGLADPDHLYAYSFATPAGSRTGREGDAKYQGIWCVIKAFDPVPRVPMQEWGFTRYGHTKILTTPEADADYEAIREKAAAWAEEHLGRNWFTNVSVNYVLQGLLQTLYTMVPDVETYIRDYQTAIKNIFRDFNDPTAALEEIFKLYNAQAEKPSMASMTEFMTEQIWQGLLEWAGQGTLYLDVERDVFSNLVWEHIPEAYVSLMMSCGEEIFDFPLKFWQVCVFDETTLDIFGWRNDGREIGDQDQLYTRMDAEGTDGVWPCVALSGGAVICLPSDMDYALLLSGPEGSASSLIIRRYTLGEVGAENFISAPVELKKDEFAWVTLSGDTAEVNYGEGFDIQSRTMTRRQEMTEGAVQDMAILSRGSGLGLTVVFGVLGTLLLALITVVILALRAYLQGRRRRASVMLLVLTGILLILTMLCDRFLPAQQGITTICKGLTTAVCLLECVLCSVENNSRRNYFMLLGFLFYLANDVLISRNFYVGMALSLVGHLLFCAAYWPGKGISRKQLAAWVLLTALGGLAVWMLRETLGDLCRPMAVYGAVLFAMLVLAWDQGWLLRLGGILFTVFALMMLWNQAEGSTWELRMTALGIYYASICMMAVGAKGRGKLARSGPEAESYVPRMDALGFRIGVTATVLFFIGEQYVMNFMAPGQIQGILQMVFRGLLGLTAFLLCLSPAWRSWKGWMFCAAGAVTMSVAGNVFFHMAYLPAAVSFALAETLLIGCFCLLRRPNRQDRILFAALWAAAAAGVVLADLWIGLKPLEQLWIAQMVGLMLPAALLALRQQGWLRIGGLLFAASQMALTAAVILNTETGLLPGAAEALHCAALLYLTGGCRRLVRAEEEKAAREKEKREEDGLKEEKARV